MLIVSSYYVKLEMVLLYRAVSHYSDSLLAPSAIALGSSPAPAPHQPPATSHPQRPDQRLNTAGAAAGIYGLIPASAHVAPIPAHAGE